MNTPKYFQFYAQVPVGLAWIYDFPQILSIPFKEKLGISEDDIQYLYLCYSLPNLFLTLLGGFFLQRYGVKIYLYAIQIVLLGQILFGIGIIMNWYRYMLIGRIQIGMGGETGIIASLYIVNKFIPKNRQRLIVALIEIMCEVSSVCNCYLTAKSFIITGSFYLPVALSLFANFVTLCSFCQFYYGNDHIHTHLIDNQDDGLSKTIFESSEKIEYSQPSQPSSFYTLEKISELPQEKKHVYKKSSTTSNMGKHARRSSRKISKSKKNQPKLYTYFYFIRKN